MKIHLKHHRIIDGKSCMPGVHELSDKMEGHWYVKGLAAKGELTVLEHSEPAPLDPPKEDAGSDSIPPVADELPVTDDWKDEDKSVDSEELPEENLAINPHKMSKKEKRASRR